MPSSSDNLARSAILYQNPSQDVFLLDIPTSIALGQQSARNAQEGGSVQSQDSCDIIPALFSTPTLENTYPAPPEPKKQKSIESILKTIPESQKQFYDDLAGPVRDALRRLKQEHSGDWCLPRCVAPVNLRGDDDTAKKSASDTKSDKQKRHLDETGLGTWTAAPDEPCLSVNKLKIRHQEAPFILSRDGTQVSSLDAVQDLIVRNPWHVPVTLHIKSMLLGEPDALSKKHKRQNSGHKNHASVDSDYIETIIPPESNFMLSRITPNNDPELPPIGPLPPSIKFDFILMDPPWSNRSVRRSSQYAYFGTSKLVDVLSRILKAHVSDRGGIAAIWVTNSSDARPTACKAMEAAGLRPLEEWVWIKTTIKGEPVVPVDSLWRKPYEVLVLGRKEENDQGASTSELSSLWTDTKRKRRVIAAVPDIHSRKPNLKELIEQVFFSVSDPGLESGSEHSTKRRDVREYSAFEVFARNLTAGWWACGDEVLKFNWAGWWKKGTKQNFTCKVKNRGC